MGQGYFDDGRIHVELGAHVFVTPSARRRNVVLAPHAHAATVLDSGGGVLSLRVTAQRVRASLGDAERYIFDLFHALACSDPGTLAFQDNLGNPAAIADSVCVAAVGQVSAFRFADVALDFMAPEQSAEPEWGSVPGTPPQYGGTSTQQDYSAGGVAIGTHPVQMRIEMTRQYPVRVIPRARGARASGPKRGAQIRFVVLAQALTDGQNLAAYLAALARQIGPRPVSLEANGNTYGGVVLESLRPAHTDRRHTGFEAEFVMQVPPCAYPTSTTTVGATTTTQRATTTTSKATTTTAPATTTTDAPGCPDTDHCVDECPEYVCTDDFQGITCGGACTGCDGTMVWQRQPASCAWTPDTNPTNCSGLPITCVSNEWRFTMQWNACGGPAKNCDYAKPATPGSCPTGTYTKTGGDIICGDCPATVVLYAYGCHGQTTTTEEVTTTSTTPGTTSTARPSTTTTTTAGPSTSSEQPATTTLPGASTTTLAPTSTTTVLIPCNDCDPPHQYTYCVAFSGLAVDFKPANGSWPVDWTPLGEDYCRWLGFDIWPDVPGYDIVLGWNEIESRWLMTLRKRLDCWKQWFGPSDPCDPSGTYEEHACDDGACDSPNTCGNSMGGKCWVCPACPCGTTTPGPTSSTTLEASTSTVLPTTTTEGPTSTTTEGPECPANQHCVDNCPVDYYCADFNGCYCGAPPTCTGTMGWHRYGPACAWDVQQTAGPCVSPQIMCSNAAWFFTMNHYDTGTSCQYEKAATATSCPGGTYSKVAGTCPGCPSEVTVYT